MKPLNVTILLFDGFSNMVLACLLEPLRAVRDQVRGGITWSVITPGDRPAISSSGHSSAMLTSPRSPSKTMRIFSSAEWCFRVRRRMSYTIDSAVGFAVPGVCLISTPWRLR
ncbi:hypothetical protein OEZ60_22150 [Defluviimonas sp. WL0024]|uniref:GlxA family transcriptional regulator n=2 Tax=Albidovulum TaxID=205889 RepID=A0ABT3JAU1_9RHOB|nr:hypothetical protein [Defluviimonas sp. WL0024]MCU9850673.1 hypothetical protein [Defluviimonas sp. WL0024]MCW3784806.1 hypothetical protein [Defluviimonas salinarum]